MSANFKFSFMSNKYQKEIDAFMENVKVNNGHEPEFLQAVHEVAEAIIPFTEEHKNACLEYNTKGNLILNDLMKEHWNNFYPMKTHITHA